jgi:hypothetical protein
MPDSPTLELLSATTTCAHPPPAPAAIIPVPVAGNVMLDEIGPHPLCQRPNQ